MGLGWMSKTKDLPSEGNKYLMLEGSRIGCKHEKEQVLFLNYTFI